jgi:hypothetical protein
VNLSVKKKCVIFFKNQKDKKFTSTGRVPDKRSLAIFRTSQYLDDRKKSGNGWRTTMAAKPIQTSGHIVGDTIGKPILAKDNQKA